MKFHRILMPFALLAAAFVVNAADYVEGEVLVKFKSTAPQTQDRLTRAIGGRVVEEIPTLGVKRVALPHGMTVGEAVAHFSKSSAVQYAEPNYIAHASVN